MSPISHILRSVTAPFQKLLSHTRDGIRERAWRIIHDATSHRGISLHLHFKAPKHAAHAISTALDRIAEVDPISFDRIPHLLPGGIIADATNYAAAWYSIRRKACVIGADTLRIGQTDDLALCIIHEMCHARLWERGIGYDGPALRLRVEEVCIRREMAFARKLEARDITPGYHTDWLAEKLAAVAQSDYSEASFQSRYRRQALQRLRLLRELDTPRWLRRWVVVRARRRMRGRAAQAPKHATKDTPT